MGGAGGQLGQWGQWGQWGQGGRAVGGSGGNGGNGLSTTVLCNANVKFNLTCIVIKAKKQYEMYNLFGTNSKGQNLDLDRSCIGRRERGGRG